MVSPQRAPRQGQWSLPVCIDAAGTSAARDLAGLIADRGHNLRQMLLDHGAVLFRGFDVRDAVCFQRVCQAFAPRLMSYAGGGSPRTRISGEVYTSTEYAPSAHMPLHGEATYFREPPQYLFFFCRIPPAQGGETPLGDMRRVLHCVGRRIVETFAEHGLLYVSNMHGGGGFNKSWQATYESEDAGEVERRLVEQGAEFAWQPNGGLRTVMRASAIRHHSLSGEAYWGNQAVNWHWADLEESTAAALFRIYKDDWSFPKSVFLGDGSPIRPEDIRHIRRILDAEEVTFSWKEGDVLLVDNQHIAHGRRPFSGSRSILVAMA